MDNKSFNYFAERVSNSQYTPNYKKLVPPLILLIWGSIGCAIAIKLGGEAKAHEISKTHKWFGHIVLGLGDIKIINIFNGIPKSKLRKNKILMGINIKLG